jgi:hypothetical protein
MLAGVDALVVLAPNPTSGRWAGLGRYLLKLGVVRRRLAPVLVVSLVGAACASGATATPAAQTPDAVPAAASTTAPASDASAAAPLPAAEPAASAPAPPPTSLLFPAPRAPEALTVAATYTLPDLPIAEIQNARLPGSVGNDRKLLLGGIGSDLWRNPSDPLGQFWVVSDRGPNGQVEVAGPDRRTFPVPDYTPLILRVGLEGRDLVVLETIPIVGHSGKPVGGLPNAAGQDEQPYDYAARAKLPFSPSGLDTEGLARTAAGDFWLADEYGPSLVKVDPTGRVVKRYVPEGVDLKGADYPVAPVLPAVYGKRKTNRGFEGLALSGDEKTLYAALQSPLANPDRKTGEASRNTRILAFDVATERVTAEYVYRFEPVAEFDPKAKRAPEEMKLSGLAWLSPGALLVLERTDWAARLYSVELSAATNVLGTKWDAATTSPALEALVDAPAAGIDVLPKSPVADLTTLPNMPDKIEGVAVVDRQTIAVVNDNDFDVGDFDRAGNNVGRGAKSHLLTIALPRALPSP